MKTPRVRELARVYVDAMRALRAARRYPDSIPDIRALNAAIAAELGSRGLEAVQSRAWYLFAPGVGIGGNPQWRLSRRNKILGEESDYVDHGTEAGDQAGMVFAGARALPLVSEAA